MIYTVTFNPSLDYIVSVPGFEMGKTNRTVYEQMLAGGKGINVTTVLGNLGIESTALGYVAGFTGEELVRRMEEMGLKNDFIRIGNGFSRINVKIRDFDGTEINGMGPVIDQEGLDALMEKLTLLTDQDTLVLAGSIPESMPGTIYSDILEKLQGRGIRFVVDATKDLLLNVLQYRPLCGEAAGDGSKERPDLDVRYGSSPFGRRGGSTYAARSERESGQCGGSRRFHGRGIPDRLGGTALLRARVPHGRGDRKRQRVLRFSRHERRSNGSLRKTRYMSCIRVMNERKRIKNVYYRSFGQEKY